MKEKNIYDVKLYVNNVFHDELLVSDEQLKMLNWLYENDWIKDDSNFEINTICHLPIEVNAF